MQYEKVKHCKHIIKKENEIHIYGFSVFVCVCTLTARMLIASDSALSVIAVLRSVATL